MGKRKFVVWEWGRGVSRKGPFLEQVATCSPYRPKLEVSRFAEHKLGMISVQQQRRRRRR